MTSISRLKAALQRQGIHIERTNNIYRLRTADSEATVLLPDGLPLEEKAVKQLLGFAATRSADGHHGVCKACATPDFHPGGIAPVGAVVATDPEFVIPAAIGTDINCGLRLVSTGLQYETIAPYKDALQSRLTHVLLDNGRNLPVFSRGFAALFDAGPDAFIDLLPREGLWAGIDRTRLLNELAACVSLDSFDSAARYAPEALVGTRELIRDPSLGTQGAGNHFVELQVVDQVLDRHTAYAAGLAKDDVVFMIHTGSRDVGFYVGKRWMDKARAAWPRQMKYPEHGLFGLSGALADEYLIAMGTAARYAWANRMALTEMVRSAIEATLGQSNSRLVVDVPHNVVLREQGLNIHRKGATPAREGELALIPGSMGDFSYVAAGLGHPDWLWSCSHGAGRSVRRQAMRRLATEVAPGSWQCVTLREERRIEEAPHAYKPVGPVIAAQEEAGLIQAAVRLRPWLTFKA
ncbi:RtcB family protein [Pseudogulbenkiania ferrooxidans]|uniref:tRNA-splicing ligase RtcB n=1 Tax=Pseudogulbenkiania ferrooxidans EGD-HP2 TaxID=1388764 RepID=A0ABN0ND06_9NEIS|nr:RtcB family protein [Pseudogulbenkiania ferrooxidans]ERE20739.1 tRNA-splicing ligase RtcB [Pseudogulbenkiania ferrooxidans EGD-HP2]